METQKLNSHPHVYEKLRIYVYMYKERDRELFLTKFNKRKIRSQSSNKGGTVETFTPSPVYLETRKWSTKTSYKVLRKCSQ